MRCLPGKVIECDEIWSFCRSKSKIVPIMHEGEFGSGDVWTWTAIDSRTMAVPSGLSAGETSGTATPWCPTCAHGSPLDEIELTTNGRLASYLFMIEPLRGSNRLDYAFPIKLFASGGRDLRYSLSAYTGIEHRIITGDPIHVPQLRQAPPDLPKATGPRERITHPVAWWRITSARAWDRRTARRRKILRQVGAPTSCSTVSPASDDAWRGRSPRMSTPRSCDCPSRTLRGLPPGSDYRARTRC